MPRPAPTESPAVALGASAATLGAVGGGAGQAALDGRYVFADECSGNLWSIDAAGNGPEEPAPAGRWNGSISSIAQAGDGTLLATDVQRGELLVLSATQN